jgi:dephospho-CoA kinase
MLIVGLTGGIGMGKSTVAKILSDFGLPVHSADQAVHALLGPGGKAVKHVAKLFPEALNKDSIDRRTLGKLVFGHPKKLKALELILHPLVHQTEKAFLAEAKRNKSPAVILEIPLLFETKAEKRCDIVLCVTAPKAVQRARVMRRRGMTEARFKAIVAQQMPDAEKRARADYVIPTGTSYAVTRKRLRKIASQFTDF